MKNHEYKNKYKWKITNSNGKKIDIFMTKEVAKKFIRKYELLYMEEMFVEEMTEKEIEEYNKIQNEKEI